MSPNRKPVNTGRACYRLDSPGGDAEMKTGQQEVYGDVLGTHTGESVGRVGLGRRRT